MNKGLTLIGSIGAGAGLMYMLDPEQGKRRRALVRDKMISAVSQTEDAMGKTGRDLRNRTTGLLAEARSRFLGKEEVSDRVVQDRVRSKIGRLARYPRLIDVTVEQGCVILSGPVLAGEVDRLLRRVSAIRGVKAVENQLDVREQLGDIAGLQGAQPRPREAWFELMQTNWSPAARFLTGAFGSGLALYSMKRRGLLGTTMATVGLGLLTRAASNLDLERILGVGAGRHAIDLQKEIQVNAPVDRVFEFWSNLENFPRFMSHVREVKNLGDGRHHWKIAGPAGISVEWDTSITQFTPNEVIAWKTEGNAAVEHAGIVRFEPGPDGSTRIHVRMSYNPPAGALGHMVAVLFGVDPKSAMDKDLVRFKSLIEEGKTTAHGERIMREDLPGGAGRRPAR
ncbi:MAG: SRPBCC family protein [Candidatus Tectomicrobia bacterium]|uniref:SRPBCC family protein n=1 Tax=Tectimicrobiota bacterium TaxID=2528274 RepID=A0A932CNS1_UNCTE|nr:SRPBCC family protein [Candidatus Tectomicrobia bacterium]